jgi:Fur family transcriptional regulator, ferric uptake regulator
LRKHRDLLTVLKSNKMRITPLRRILIQFILDNQGKQISPKEIQDYLVSRLSQIDRTSLYRNIEMLKKLDIIRELKIPNIGKRFQYVFDRQVHHYYICKACGKLKTGNHSLFGNIEKALKRVPGFRKANLAAVFYGYCPKCPKPV